MIFVIKSLYTSAFASVQKHAGSKVEAPVTMVNKRSISPPLTAIPPEARVSLTNAGYFRQDGYVKPKQPKPRIATSDSVKTVGSVYSTLTVEQQLDEEDGVKYFDVDGVKRGNADPLPLDGRFPSSESFAPDDEMLPWTAHIPTQLDASPKDVDTVTNKTRPKQIERAPSNEEVRELIRKRVEAREILRREAMGGEIEDEERSGAKLSRVLAIGKKAGREIKEKSQVLKPYKLPASDFGVVGRDDEWVARYKAVRSRSRDMKGM